MLFFNLLNRTNILTGYLFITEQKQKLTLTFCPVQLKFLKSIVCCQLIIPACTINQTEEFSRLNDTFNVLI